MPSIGHAFAICTTLPFVFQMFATFSVPFTRNFYLADFGGIKFGVFGWCNNATNICSNAALGYDFSLLGDHAPSTFPNRAKLSLATLLVVHPIGLFLTSVLWLSSICVGFFQSSYRPLVIIIFWSVLTYIHTVLCFLVNVMLFFPYMNWQGWAMLGSSFLVMLSSSLACLLRRNVSYKDFERRARIEDIELYPLSYSNASHRLNEDHEELLTPIDTERSIPEGISSRKKKNEDFELIELT
ncbi:HDR153Wp [Eremothecium sinecaudum]|uniref:HDR153Wp n=1 Tax=Eremothecium sinecaudum TaxID=45286 RepID=A0A109UZ53_9SACH|nr:HDR153Wp [Eremothecium sinecaudum]AMD20895.1 HDR153Wp [Eremothecium sinecaudum]